MIVSAQSSLRFPLLTHRPYKSFPNLCGYVLEFLALGYWRTFNGLRYGAKRDSSSWILLELEGINTLLCSCTLMEKVKVWEEKRKIHMPAVMQLFFYSETFSWMWNQVTSSFWIPIGKVFHIKLAIIIPILCSKVKCAKFITLCELFDERLNNISFTISCIHAFHVMKDSKEGLLSLDSIGSVNQNVLYCHLMK